METFFHLTEISPSGSASASSVSETAQSGSATVPSSSGSAPSGSETVPKSRRRKEMYLAVTVAESVIQRESQSKSKLYKL